MLNHQQLPLHFDPKPLEDDLAKIADGEWIAHFNTQYYKGEWSVAALRSVGGAAAQIYPDPTRPNDFADTSLLARCGALREAMAAFKCPIQSARLLKLAAGARIREHRDYNLGYEDGEIRLHIPILTNDDVEFMLAGEQVVMRPGETWYLNFNLPHSVANLGATDRIHLVIDCRMNEWLDGLFN
ncbi:MAG: aspartyl/asparaginyl beta-hydroxylase domain-containing protein [Blastocatellales bacterium]